MKVKMIILALSLLAFVGCQKMIMVTGSNVKDKKKTTGVVSEINSGITDVRTEIEEEK